MKTKLFYFVGILVVFFACNKEEDPFLPPPEPDTKVNFTDLRQGQESTFIRYRSTCDSLEELFHYTGDTLRLSVVERQGGELAFREEAIYANLPDTIYIEEYPVTVTGDSLYIPERSKSRLFFFYGNDYINFKPQNVVNLIQNGCHLLQAGQPFVGDDIGSVSSFEIGDIRLDDKAGVSCVPMIDIDAYLIYDRDYLFLSHTIFISEFFGEITETIDGWKMLD